MNRWRGDVGPARGVRDGDRPRRVLRRLLLVADAGDVRRRARQPRARCSSLGGDHGRREERCRGDGASAARWASLLILAAVYAVAAMTERRRMLGAWMAAEPPTRRPAPSVATGRRADTRAAILEAARVVPARRRLREPLDPARRRGRRASRSARSTTTSARSSSSSSRSSPPRTSGCSSASASMFDGARAALAAAGSGPATSSTTDLESGYVRILQEMIAAGWSDAEVAASVREHARRLVSRCWPRSRDARQERGGDLGPFTPGGGRGADGDCRSSAPRS